MTELCIAAFFLLIWRQARAPSEELFEEADSYYAAAEHYDSVACLETAHALTRKALRRMPWRLL